MSINWQWLYMPRTLLPLVTRYLFHRSLLTVKAVSFPRVFAPSWSCQHSLWKKSNWFLTDFLHYVSPSSSFWTQALLLVPDTGVFSTRYEKEKANTSWPSSPESRCHFDLAWLQWSRLSQYIWFRGMVTWSSSSKQSHSDGRMNTHVSSCQYR
jgi:hypothetical protein